MTFASIAQESIIDSPDGPAPGGPAATEPSLAPDGQVPADAEYAPGEIVIKLRAPAVVAMRSPLAAGQPALNAFPESVRALNERHGVGRATPLFAGFLAHEARMRALRSGSVRPRNETEWRLLRRDQRAPNAAEAPSLEGVYRLFFGPDPGIGFEAIIAEYRADPNVEYAEPNYIVHTIATPNDPLFAQQWALHNTGQLYPSSGAYNLPPGTPDSDIDAPEAWDVTTGSADVVIAVLDTGVDYAHRDLVENINVNVSERDGLAGVDDDANGYVDDVYGYDFTTFGQVRDSDPIDDNGHGTHCAGVIAATRNNGLDLSGVASTARIMPVKFMDGTGTGYSSDAADAVYYAVANGAEVLSMSFESSGPHPFLRDAIAYAATQGVFMVAAAGNSNGPYLRWPARFYEVLGVGATDSNDVRAPFSNYAIWTELAAPGVDILSLRAAGTSLGLPYDTYTTTASGTSMAAPYAAGVAALVMSQNPAFTPAEVRSVLKMTSDPYTSTKYIGQGRVNAAQALSITDPPVVAFLDMEGLLAEQGYASGFFDIRGTAAGPGFASYSLYYGAGENPSEWTLFHSSSVPVVDGVLFSGFDAALLWDGLWTIRLTVFDQNGLHVEELRYIRPKGFFGSNPMDNDILNPRNIHELRAETSSAVTLTNIAYGQGWYPTTWFTTGITLDANPGDDVFGFWDTSSITENGFYTLRYAFSTPWGPREGFVRSVYFDTRLKDGWPQYVFRDATTNLLSGVNFSTADLDGDGFVEVIALEEGRLFSDRNPRLLVYNHDGSVKWVRVLDYFPMELDVLNYPVSAYPVAADIDRDGRMEVFVDIGQNDLGTRYALYGFRHDGSDIPGWPVLIPLGSGETAIADVIGDADLELVVRSRSNGREAIDGVVYWVNHVYVIDASGTIVNTIPIPSAGEGSWLRFAQLTVGNFDGDSELEIATHYGVRPTDWSSVPYNPDVYPAIYNPDGTLLAGWPKVSDSSAVFAIVAGDLDGDGTDELITAQAQDKVTGVDGGFFAYDASGNVLPGWPIHTELKSSDFGHCGVALSDLDGDGNVEICIGYQKTIGLYDRNANPLPGWPVTLGSGFSALMDGPVLADITGDGAIDMIARGGALQPAGLQSGAWNSSGGIWAWHQDGTPIDLNPDPGDLYPIWLELWYRGRAAVTDLDANGLVDIVAGSFNNVTLGDWRRYKNRDTLYAFELDAAHAPELMDWPQWQGGPANTGRYIHPNDIVPTFLRIFGPAQVVEGETGSFTSVARFNNQQTRFVTNDVVWSEDSPNATIDSQGLFTAGQVESSEVVTVTAALGSVTASYPVLLKALIGITVESPNGGETVHKGETVPISWIVVGDPGPQVRIELLLNGSVIKILTRKTANSGIYEWTVQNNLSEAAGYQIRISSTADSAFTDTSDAGFSILGSNGDTAPPTITILGENPVGVEPGSVYVDAGATAFDEVDGDLTASIVTTNNVDTNVQGRYEVVYGVSDSSGNTASATRVVYVGAVPIPFTILTPATGDTWGFSSTQSIAWASASNATAVRLDLYKGGVYVRSVSKSTANDGDFTWNVPNDKRLSAGSDYQIKIENRDDSTEFAFSDTFSIGP